MQELEQQINTLIERKPLLSPEATLSPELFSQPRDFEMPSIGSFFKISNGNVAVIALGVIMTSTVGGFLANWLPSISQYASIIAGALIMYIGKGKSIVKDFGVGVLIGGLAQLFSGLGSSLSGIFGEKPMMMEDKITYGGGDGVYPMQPERRTFS